MGTPASDEEAVTQLSLELEGLRISITRTRAALPSSSASFSVVDPLTPRTSSVQSVRQPPTPPSQVDRSGSSASRDPNPPTLRPVGSPEPRSSIEASFPAIPSVLLDSARNLRSSVSSPSERATRAWVAGCWAGAVLQGRSPTPNCTPRLSIPSRIYVILRTPRNHEVQLAYNRSDYLVLVDNLRSTYTLSHGFPTETEARVYVAGAGLRFPAPASR